MTRAQQRHAIPRDVAVAQAAVPDLGLQDKLLPGVSRTFALTIPQLPEPLRVPVTNAYLLCRIADTIEDEPALTAQEKQHFHNWFVSALRCEASAAELSQTVHARLSDSTIPAERDLILHLENVLAITQALPAVQQQSLKRCVAIMCSGMPEFQHSGGLDGLASLRELERYCYFVAGVVGEMLTELFCDYSATIASQRDKLMALSVRFGQGLQMTNILKDIWEDRTRNACWLPRDLFRDAGVELGEMRPDDPHSGFNDALNELIAVAHARLRDALRYTLIIPAGETGIRRFCLWAIGMAVLTLRKIYRNPGFSAGGEVKISRRSVRATILASNLSVRSNRMLVWLFGIAAAGLPLADDAQCAAVTGEA